MFPDHQGVKGGKAKENISPVITEYKIIGSIGWGKGHAPNKCGLHLRWEVVTEFGQVRDAAAWIENFVNFYNFYVSFFFLQNFTFI